MAIRDNAFNPDIQPPNALNSMHSPLRYIGGKFWIRGSILPLIAPHNHYLEPFAGGASIFFLQSGGHCSHLNDLDSELINCYFCIRDHPEDLIARLSLLEVNPNTHRFMRDQFQPVDDLGRAARFFFLNHTSFAGVTHPKGCYWGRRSPLTLTHVGWTRRIRMASARLQGVHLTNQDFEAVIEAAPDGAFLYVDAPFRSARHDKYYAHSFRWEEHKRLALCLRRHSVRLRFLSSYDDCTEIRDIYDWAPRITSVVRPNRIDRLDKGDAADRAARHSVGREILIRNYAGPSHKWAILAPTDARPSSEFINLADDQWAEIELLLPPLPRRADGRGRPWKESREILDGILWVLSRKAIWNTLPPRCYPPYQTCHRRYLRWLREGTLSALIYALQEMGGPNLSHIPALSAQTAPDTSA